MVRPPEENNFVLEVVQSKSFKQHNAVKEITYRAKLKNPSEDVPLNLLPQQLHALFDTILAEAKEEYGESGVVVFECPYHLTLSAPLKLHSNWSK